MIEADEDQAVRGSQLGSGRRRALQDDELLPEIDDLGLSLSPRATQPPDQRRAKSEKTGHPARILPDAKGVARLDKIIGSDGHADIHGDSGVAISVAERCRIPCVPTCGSPARPACIDAIMSGGRTSVPHVPLSKWG